MKLCYADFCIFEYVDLVIGVGATWRTANVEKGSTVAIFGLGSIGLAVRMSCLFTWFQ